MPRIYLRIFVFYNLIYSIFLYIFPKKLKNHQKQQQIQNDTVPQSNSPRSSRMNHTELHRIFQMFDKNGDGRITNQELHDSLQNMNIFITDSDLVELIGKIDVNGDGCVDIDEFGDLYKLIMDDRENEEDMIEAFNVFDQNGDGFIAVDELSSVLESLGLKQGRKSDDDCRKMIMKVDGDGDGRVSFEEFKEMMRSGGFATMAENRD